MINYLMFVVLKLFFHCPQLPTQYFLLFLWLTGLFISWLQCCFQFHSLSLLLSELQTLWWLLLPVILQLLFLRLQSFISINQSLHIIIFENLKLLLFTSKHIIFHLEFMHLNLIRPHLLLYILILLLQPLNQLRVMLTNSSQLQRLLFLISNFVSPNLFLQLLRPPLNRHILLFSCRQL